MSANERQRIVSGWEEWRRILYEERAAIQEYLGKLPRDEAERQAFERYKPAPVAVQGRLDL